MFYLNLKDGEPFGFSNVRQADDDIEITNMDELHLDGYIKDPLTGQISYDKDFVKARDVRAARNELLRESDWSQLPDAPASHRQAYALYRQALRDIPQQAGFPTDINWPTKPE